MADLATLRRAYTECRLGQMHYLEGAPSSSSGRVEATLVLLHQNPSTSAEYEPLVRAMARDRRVIAFDTPGYGMSDGPTGPLSIADYAANFGDAIDSLGLTRDGPIDVFGYHSGALLAAELGLQRPDAVRSLALCGVPMRSAEECAQRLAQARNSPRPTDDGAALLAQSASLWSYVVTQRSPGVSLERAAALFAEKNKPLHRGWWVYDAVWRYPTAERLALITQPTLFLAPHDTLRDETRTASALVARGTLADFPDLHRDIFELGAEQIAAGLRAFFALSTTTAGRPALESAS